MTRFARERPDAGYYRGYVGGGNELATVVRNIDEKTKKAISESGGTWAPSTPIVIGGAGIELHCRLQLSGATAAPGLGNAFRFGDNDYFAFDTPRARTIDVSPLEAIAKLTFPREAAPILSSDLGVTPAVRGRRPGARFTVPIRVPDGARLATVEIAFKVGTAHATVPANLPRARVVRINAGGVIEKHPDVTSSSASPEGWVSPSRPASGALWYAAGALQTFTLVFDSMLGERADHARYSYALQWLDESGAGAFAVGTLGNHLMHIRVGVLAPDMRPY